MTGGTLSDSFANSEIVTAGYYDGGSSVPVVVPRTVAPSINANPVRIVPGLFVGRPANNYKAVTSLDQLTTPTVNEVKGVVGKKTTTQALITNTTFSYANLQSFFIETGKIVPLLPDIWGRIYVWVGETFNPTDADNLNKVFIATTSTTTAGSEVWSGSLVSHDFTGALEITAIASYNFEGTPPTSVTKGSILPLRVSQLSA